MYIFNRTKERFQYQYNTKMAVKRRPRKKSAVQKLHLKCSTFMSKRWKCLRTLFETFKKSLCYKIDSCVVPFVAKVSSSVTNTTKYVRYCKLKGQQKVLRLSKILKLSINEKMQVLSKPTVSQCAICYEALQDKDKVQKMCHDSFHDECLQTAVKSGLHTCPLCRAPIPVRIVTQEFRKTLLLHTANCREGRCGRQDCGELKLLFGHVKRCRFKSGCTLCIKMGLHLKYHHHECVDFFCKVPMCFFPWNK